jgi:hypothetical protein
VGEGRLWERLRIYSGKLFIAIKLNEGSKSGKKHPLPIDLFTENKKAKRSAYEKERRPGQSFNRKWEHQFSNVIDYITITL